MSKTKPTIYYPENYREDLALNYNNGCGPGGWKGLLIPDNLLGVSIATPCKIHDYKFEVGVDYEDMFYANVIFWRNMKVEIINKSKWYSKWLNPIRRKLAYQYYIAVHESGSKYFYDKVEPK